MVQIAPAPSRFRIHAPARDRVRATAPFRARGTDRRRIAALAPLLLCTCTAGPGRPAWSQPSPTRPRAESLRAEPLRAEPPRTRSAFHEADQAIAELLLHFDPDRRSDLLPVHRDLARALDPHTRITVAVADARHVAAGRRHLKDAGYAPDRCRFVVCDGPISIWARDRLIPFYHSTGVQEFFQPDRRRVDAGVTGDIRLAQRLSLQRHGRILSGWYLEGGNVVFGSGRVFVGRTVVGENRALPGGVARILDNLRKLFDAEPVLLGGASGVPNPHVDMFLTHAGEGRVLLGDPALGLDLLRSARSTATPGAQDDPLAGVQETTQRALIPKYEAIRRQLLDAGLRVERLPILHTASYVVFTWNNALVERRADGRRAYVPVYGVPRLDDVALATYRRLGFKTFPIDAKRIVRRGGTVRCLTNVLAWSGAVPPGARPPGARPRRHSGGAPPLGFRTRTE